MVTQGIHQKDGAGSMGHWAGYGNYLHAYIFSCLDGSFQFATSDGPDGDGEIGELDSPSPLGHDADRTVSMSSRPNPFASETELTIHFSEPRNAEIALYDFYGRAMRSIAKWSSYKEGSNSIVLHKNELAAGIYYCVLRTDQETIVHKLIIL